MSGRGFWVGILLLSVSILLGLGVWSGAWAAANDQTFYNQGQARYDARDPEKSRTEAITDLKREILRQAIENLVDEDKLAARKADIQNRFVKNPDRYVRSYQVVSQEVDNGVLRVAGQAVVNIDELVSGLRDLGLIVVVPPAAGNAAEPSGEASGSNVVNDQNATSDEEPAEEATEADEEGPAGQGLSGGEKQDQTPPTAADLQKRIPVLWWVAEKWEQNSPWHVPGGDELGVAMAALFAASMRQEAQALSWSLILPDRGSDVMVQEGDGGRDIPVDQAKVAARGRKAGVVVVGTATQQRRPDGKVGLVADLAVLDVTSGDRMGEVHRESVLTRVDNPGDAAEEIIKLAAWVAPELDRLVRGASMGELRPHGVDQGNSDQEEAEPAEEDREDEDRAPAESLQEEQVLPDQEPGDSVGEEQGRPDHESGDNLPAEQAQPDQTQTGGPDAVPHKTRAQGWTLVISPFRSLAQWEQLEQALRQKFAGLEVAALELSAGKARVELDHVADNLPTVLKELQLQTLRIEVQEANVSTRTIHLSVVPSGTAP